MNRNNTPRGVVLLIVLGILALMSVLALTFVSMSRLERNISRNYLDGVRAMLAAESGVEYARSRLSDFLISPFDQELVEDMAFVAGAQPGLEHADRVSFGRPGQPGVSGDTGSGDVFALQVDAEDARLNLNDSNGRYNMDADAFDDDLQNDPDIVNAPSRLEEVTAALGDVMFPGLGALMAQNIFAAREAEGGRFSNLDQVHDALMKGVPTAGLSAVAGFSDEDWLSFETQITLWNWQDPNILRPTHRWVVSTPAGEENIPDTWKHNVFLWSDFQTRRFELEPRSPVNVNLASVELLEALIRPLRGWYLVEGPGHCGPLDLESGSGYGWTGAFGKRISCRFFWRDIADTDGTWSFDCLPAADYRVETGSRIGQQFETPPLDEIGDGSLPATLAKLLYDRVHGIDADGDGDYSDGGDAAPDPIETWQEFEYALETSLKKAIPDNSTDLIRFWDDPYDDVLDWTSPRRDIGVTGPCPYPMPNTYIPTIWSFMWNGSGLLPFRMGTYCGGAIHLGFPGVDVEYWTRHCRDILRDMMLANFNPNSQLNDYNPDRHLRREIDKAQLTQYTAELCFTPCGMFRIRSLGTALNDDGAIAARKDIIAVVQLAQPFRITTQAQFMKDFAGDPTAYGATSTSYDTAWNTTIMSYPEPLLKGGGSTADGGYFRDSVYDGYVMPATQRVDFSVGASPTMSGCFEGGLRLDQGGDIDVIVNGASLFTGDHVWNMPTDNRLTHAATASWNEKTIPGCLVPDGALSDPGRSLVYDSASNVGSSGMKAGSLAFWVKPNFDTRATSRIHSIVDMGQTISPYDSAGVDSCQGFSLSYFAHYGYSPWEAAKKWNFAGGVADNTGSYVSWQWLNPTMHVNNNTLVFSVKGASWPGQTYVFTPTVTHSFPNQLNADTAPVIGLPIPRMRATHHSYWFESHQWSHVVLGWSDFGYVGAESEHIEARCLRVNGRYPIDSDGIGHQFTGKSAVNFPCGIGAPGPHLRFGGDASAEGSNYPADCTFDEIVAYPAWYQYNNPPGLVQRETPAWIDDVYAEYGRYHTPIYETDIAVYQSPGWDLFAELNETRHETIDILSVSWTVYWPKYNRRLDCKDAWDGAAGLWRPTLVNEALLPMDIHRVLPGGSPDSPDPLAAILAPKAGIVPTADQESGTWVERFGPTNGSVDRAGWGWVDAVSGGSELDPMSVDIARVSTGGESWAADQDGDGDIYDDHAWTFSYAGGTCAEFRKTGEPLRYRRGEKMKFRAYFNIEPSQMDANGHPVLAYEVPVLDDITFLLRQDRVMFWNVVQ